MESWKSRPRQVTTEHGDTREIPAFVPRIDMQDVFRQLIADELRDGRLTPARRRRIVRYAAQLGLSAVQAGRLVDACRKEALAEGGAPEHLHALRLVPPIHEKVAPHVKIALLVVGAIFLDLLLVLWVL